VQIALGILETSRKRRDLGAIDDQCDAKDARDVGPDAVVDDRLGFGPAPEVNQRLGQVGDEVSAVDMTGETYPARQLQAGLGHVGRLLMVAFHLQDIREVQVPARSCVAG
jgi:hypothetical protein